MSTADTSSKSDSQRKEALGRAVANQLAQGGFRVETQSDFNAVMVKGKKVNHALHITLSVLSVGMWLFVYVPLIFISGEKRQMVSVDEFGNVRMESL